MLDRFQLMFDGTVFDNLTMKRYEKANELLDTLNEINDRLTDYDERHTTESCPPPSHALQLG
jgi:hypothetical protein